MSGLADFGSQALVKELRSRGVLRDVILDFTVETERVEDIERLSPYRVFNPGETMATLSVGEEPVIEWARDEFKIHTAGRERLLRCRAIVEEAE